MIVVAGDEAGGNLAAAVAVELGDSSIKLQLLINPALQMMNFATPSYQEEQENNLIPGITSREREIDCWMRYANIGSSMKPYMQTNIHVSWKPYRHQSRFIESRMYIPAHLNVTQKHTIHNNKSVDRVLDHYVLDTRLNPMFLMDVRHVPDAYIVTAQYDVLRDEALMYGKRLQDDGVTVEMAHYHHGFHGFFLFAGGGWLELEESRQAMKDLNFYLHTEVLGLPVSDIR